MKIHLKKLCPSDGEDIYIMLQEFPENENGFINPTLTSIDSYKSWLSENAASSSQTGLVDGWKVPQTIYWLFADGKPVGYSKIRYSIRPGQRNKGFGKILLTELIKECSDLGIKKALLTIHKNNAASIKVALDSHGIIEKSSDTLHYIWIECC